MMWSEGECDAGGGKGEKRGEMEEEKVVEWNESV